MIELPNWGVPNAAAPALVDYGGTQRGVGGTALRVDRNGSHYRIGLGFPVFEGEREGRIIVSRLIRAKREGLRVPYPLPEPQPIAGTPVVDGAGQAGLTLNMRGVQPGTAIREGYWFSIERSDGQHFLHNVGGGVIVGSDGRAAVPLSELLRYPFADGTPVHFTRPMIEGPIEGDAQQWALDVECKVAIECMIEEAA